jgi:hypothetical protein
MTEIDRPPRKDFPEIDDVVRIFEDRSKTGLSCIVLLFGMYSGFIFFPQSKS